MCQNQPTKKTNNPKPDRKEHEACVSNSWILFCLLNRENRQIVHKCAQIFNSNLMQCCFLIPKYYLGVSFFLSPVHVACIILHFLITWHTWPVCGSSVILLLLLMPSLKNVIMLKQRRHRVAYPHSVLSLRNIGKEM